MTTQELIDECRRRGIKTELPADPVYTPIVRYNRGLGPEYLTLKPIHAPTPAEALRLAGEAAEKAVAAQDPQAEVVEVKVRPG